MSASARFPWRFFSRLVIAEVLLVLLALFGSGLAARHFFKEQLVEQLENRLKNSLIQLEHHLPVKAAQTTRWCVGTARDTDVRITLIDRAGKVLCDSRHDPATMENHSQRAEVAAAWKGGFGASVRFSRTLDEDMLYGALAVPPRGLLIRGALDLAKIQQVLAVFDRSLAVFLGVIGLVLVAFGVWFGKEMASPMSRLLEKVQALLRDPTRPGAVEPEQAQTEAFGEWSLFESSLEDVRRHLEDKIESLVVQREQQATLMGAISDAILAVDRDGVPLFYNARFAVLFHDRGIKARRLLWEMFREPELLEAFHAAIRDGLSQSGNTVATEEAGRKRYFSAIVSPLRRSAGEIYGAVCVFHDVTELKQAEQMRIDFVANVSHELRTPLTAIKGYTDTILEDMRQGRPVSPQFVEPIARNSDRLMVLINDLLDLSSLESTEVLQKTTVSTRELTDRVLGQLQGRFARKRQNAEVKVSAAAVNADPRRLEQVLVNLLDNAHKYAPEGGRIAVSWEAEEEGAVLLKVSDTGPGIAPEHQGRIFERFYRVDKARSRDLGGTGLGLAIVKHILQRHGGGVWVESVPGKGAVFICRFPS